MQVPLAFRLIAEAGEPRLAPGQPAALAWSRFLEVHAALERVLDVELRQAAGMPLGDFDALIQLAFAPAGPVRMTDLAHRVLISRSGMTRRIADLERRGLVERGEHPTDARATTVALTQAGTDALAAALPVHLRGIARHFCGGLTDEELSDLAETLGRVSVTADFG